MKKILPPVLFVLFILAMGLICWGMGAVHNIYYPYSLIGLVLIFGGLLLAASGKKLFKKLDVNIMTFDQPGALVTEGVFNYSRNPMYLGFVIAMVGFALLFGAALSSLLLALLFFVITDRWYIAFEEQAMREKFGLAYEKYCQRVRRWI